MVLLVYLLFINVFAFGLMGLDRRFAETRQERIPEKALLRMALAGGSVGGTIGMYFWHHKTRDPRFAIGFPLLLFAHVALLGLLLLVRQ